MLLGSCLKYKQALVQMFKDAAFVQDALKDDETENVLKSPVKRREYTVLLPKTFPTLHHEPPLSWRYLEEIPVCMI